MGTVQALRGTRDLLPPEIQRWQWVERTATAIFELYGYREIRTPVLEERNLFVRSIGSDSDIVQKELYAFQDKGQRLIALRPEATASAVRAYLGHHLDREQRLVKWYYIGPMFRAERPQAGRQRQFHQLGVEAIGSFHPALDAELILLSWHLVEALGINLARCQVRLNNLGCNKDKRAYRERLKRSIKPLLGRLCDDCHTRFERNPMRILDCKRDPCRKAISGLLADPAFSSSGSCPSCQQHLATVRELLNIDPGLAQRSVVEPRLVRGLEYYTKTVFEITHASLGAQDALCGGGRYDHLVEEFGGPSTGAAGFAFGQERLLLAMTHDGVKEPFEEPLAVFLAVLKPELFPTGLRLMQGLRAAGFTCHADYETRSLKSQMRFADRLGARWVVILGEEEVKRNGVTLKDFVTKEQQQVPQDELIGRLRTVPAHHQQTRVSD